MWSEWWVWMSAAVALGILEVIVPGYVFIGFGVGAAVTGLIFLVGGPLAAWLAGSWTMTALVFAVASLVSWIAVRLVLGVRKGQVTTFDRDINED